MLEKFLFNLEKCLLCNYFVVYEYLKKILKNFTVGEEIEMIADMKNFFGEYYAYYVQKFGFCFVKLPL